jgi:hypothetical protein
MSKTAMAIHFTISANTRDAERPGLDNSLQTRLAHTAA